MFISPNPIEINKLEQLSQINFTFRLGMGFFSKAKSHDAWLAICVGVDGLRAASVTRVTDARPVVSVCLFQPASGAAGSAPLERLGKQLHAARYDCTTLLNSGQYQLLAVDAPNVPPDELKTAVRWRLKDMLDFHIDDATIDVLDIPQDKNAPTRGHTMFAVAARNQVISDRQALFDAAKVRLRAIDIPEMAQRNISALAEPPGRGLAMLAFDDEGGLLTITYAGELYLARRIDVSLAQLNDGDVEQRNGNYDRITLELQRSLDHFDRQYHYITLAKLVLAPMGEAAAPLLAYLTANLYVPVESLALASVLDFDGLPELQSEQAQQQFFLALGGALRHEETQL
jgi:MSHA biogenesis protein MshI